MDRFFRKWIRCWARSCLSPRLPEPVPGQRGGHQRGRERERGQPRKAAQRQQGARHDLDGTVDAHRLLGLAGYRGHPIRDRPDHRLRLCRNPLGPQNGVRTLDNENRRQHRARESSEYRHRCHLARLGGLLTPHGRNARPASWHRGVFAPPLGWKYAPLAAAAPAAHGAPAFCDPASPGRHDGGIGIDTAAGRGGLLVPHRYPGGLARTTSQAGQHAISCAEGIPA